VILRFLDTRGESGPEGNWKGGELILWDAFLDLRKDHALFVADVFIK
jgi:hypothetical protein